MPPRRSARAPSAKSAAKPASKASAKDTDKPAPRSRSRAPAKRAASPDTSPSPPPATKRTRTVVTKEKETVTTVENNTTRGRSVKRTTAVDTTVVPAKKSRAKTPTAKAEKEAAPKVAKEPKQAKPKPAKMQAPYFNPLPIPPAHMRPPYQLWGWGAGNFGQLGMGPDLLGEYPKPKRNLWIEEQIKKGTFGDEEGAGLEAIAAGGMHTIFIDEKGTVWSCGVNDEGALGRVTTDVPNPENPDEKLDVDQLTATPYPLQTLIDENFRAVKIAAGDNVCAAVSTEGELRVWGSFRDNQGSLGFSSESQRQFLPAPILELKHHSGNVEKFVSVASGNNHLLVLTTHGNVYTLGAGEEGQLGRKVIQRRKIHGTAPEKIVLGTRTRRAKVVGAGNNASFAVDERGVVWGWGLNTMGQTGTGYSNASVDGEVHSPKQVVGLSKEELDGDEVVQIAGGDHHTLFLTASGKVYACGRSNDGQLGLAKDDPAFKDREHENFLPTPALVTFPDPSDPVVQVSAGTHNNLAVTEGGALYAWGAQTQGELGIGDDEEALTPTVIVRKQGGSWSAHSVSCGGQHTIALFRKKS